MNKSPLFRLYYLNLVYIKKFRINNINIEHEGTNNDNK